MSPHGQQAGLVFVSYGGLLNVATVAEEIKNPGRAIALGIIGFLIVVVLFYTVIVFVTTGVLSSESLDNSLTPISTGASAFMGRAGMIAMSLTAVLAFVSTANASIMSASRYLFSLSRDDLRFDRFDEIVEHALIIDSNLELNDVGLFSLVGEAIHERCKQDTQSIQQALIAREEEGSTMLTEKVAASDIVIEGEGVFELVMVRCSRGVLLRGAGEPVHAFFLLLTSRDERDFYLKAVASIAQIVQTRSFDERWLKAHTEQQIRDVVLLGERRRICEL